MEVLNRAKRFKLRDITVSEISFDSTRHYPRYCVIENPIQISVMNASAFNGHLISTIQDFTCTSKHLTQDRRATKHGSNRKNTLQRLAVVYPSGTTCWGNTSVPSTFCITPTDRDQPLFGHCPVVKAVTGDLPG